jgi:hypothetical protein
MAVDLFPVVRQRARRRRLPRNCPCGRHAPLQFVPLHAEPQRNFIIALSLGALAFELITPNAFSAEPFYIGTWNITSAVVAPWWEDLVHQPDPSESASLVGKSVTFGAKRIEGPRQFMCSALKYRVRNYPADGLFQGEFGEMHLRNKAVDPAKMAALVGFSKGTSWKTVETGCGNELDFHFIDERTAAFGLNNYSAYSITQTELTGFRCLVGQNFACRHLGL